MDRDRQPVRQAGGAGGQHRVEGVRVAEVVAERHDPARPVAFDQALDRLALATGVTRPQVHHGPAAVRPQAVVGETEPSLDRGDRVEHRRPGSRDVVRLADMERDRGALALDEQPRRPPELVGDTRGERLGRDAVGLEPGLDGGRDPVRRAAPIEPGRLQAVVAEILDAADPGTRCDIRDGPPGQDGHVQAAGPGVRDPGQASERAPGARVDGRRRGVARAGRQRAVEIRDDEQGCRRRHEPVERGGDVGRRGRLAVDGRDGSWLVASVASIVGFAARLARVAGWLRA